MLSFNRRGLPSGAELIVGCDPVTDAGLCATGATYRQAIVGSIEYLRDGLVETMTWGDTRDRDGLARTPTSSTTEYDLRRRPVRMTTVRVPTVAPDPSRPLGAVRVVHDQELVWDAVSNLTGILDHRDPREWRPGHRPQSVHVRHDSLYRVVGAEYDYTQDDGTRAPTDAGTDWRDVQRAIREAGADPMDERPAPMVPLAPPTRVASLVWTWDWLGNTTEWDDDESAFYERSIGAITNGFEAGRRPSALYLSTNLPTSPGGSLDPAGSGWVEVDYGEGGNVVAMTVHGRCADADVALACYDDPALALDARRSHLRSRCACATEQHYQYRWDELNRVAEARRWDREAPSPEWTLAVRQRYRYDGANQRTVKQTLEPSSEEGEPPGPGEARERIALYVYPGDFERRGLERSAELGYEPGLFGTETQFWSQVRAWCGATTRSTRTSCATAESRSRSAT